MKRFAQQKEVRLCAVLLAAFLAVLSSSGCVLSPTITEVIYNSEETSEVDPDITPVLVNTVDAEETSDALPKLSDDDTDTQVNTTTSQPYYTTDASKANSTEPALRPVYAKSAESAGEVGGKTEDEDEQDSDWDSLPTEDETDDGVREEEDEQADTKSETSSTESSNDDGDGWEDVDAAGSGGNKGKGEGTGTEGGEGKGAGDDSSDDAPGGSKGGTGTVYSGDADSDPEIPDNIDEVAAVGNNAVIVSMVSGDAQGSALVACDADTQNKTSALLAQRGINEAQPLWDNDGDEIGDMSDESFQALLKDSRPDLVFVTEGDLAFTDDQLEALSENGIDVYYLPRLTSAKRIRFAVQVVGKILARGGVEGAEEAYASYLDYEQELVNRYSGYNGGMTGGYDLNLGKSASAAPETYVTLLIDEWDEGARHDSSLIDTQEGVAVSTLGFRSAPVSYYLSVGGVLNNAASKVFRTLSGTGMVWQFVPTELSFSFSKWQNASLASYDVARRVTGGLYRADLLWNTAELDGAGYGTQSFPAVVAKSWRIANLFESNSQSVDEGSPKKLYSAYPVIYPSGGNGMTMGFFKYDSLDGTYVESCIGRVDKAGSLEQATSDNLQIFVNPKGLCQEDSSDDLCSWTDGSVESVLEASWAYWKFRGGSEEDFRADVIDFYDRFYGYDVSGELDSIVAGAES